jgi:hypothetical protein
MGRPTRYPQEIGERAMRMVAKHRGEYPSEWAAMCSNRREARDDAGDAAHLDLPV